MDNAALCPLISSHVYNDVCVCSIVFDPFPRLAGVCVSDVEKLGSKVGLNDSGGGIRARQMDTNVVAATFQTLGNVTNIHTGDVVKCCNEDCNAILSYLSKINGESHQVLYMYHEVLLCRFMWSKDFSGTSII